MPVTTQNPLDRAIEMLTGAGIQEQANVQQDRAAGRNLQLGGLMGRIDAGGGYLNTLARDQFESVLAEASRGYALDVARFGLAQADLNYRQRSTEAQNRMQEMALQVSQRGPANAIGYNYLLGNRAAPQGQERPIQPSGVSQPSNIQIPGAAASAASPNPNLAADQARGAAMAAGINAGTIPNPSAQPQPAVQPQSAQSPVPQTGADPFATGGLANNSALAQAVTQAQANNQWGVPRMAYGGTIAMPPEQGMAAPTGAPPSMAGAPPMEAGAPPTVGGLSQSYKDGMMDGLSGSIDQARAQADPDYAAGAQAAQQAGQQGGATAVVGDATGGRTGHEEVATASVGPGGAPQLTVAPIPDGAPLPPVSRAASGGMFGGTANTFFSPQEIADTPAVRQATGQEKAPRFGAFAGDTSIPGTDTNIPFGAGFRADTFADMLPSSRALLESIVGSPREQGGLGLDFADFLESSRRAAPIGRRFAPAAYGA